MKLFHYNLDLHIINEMLMHMPIGLGYNDFGIEPRAATAC